MHLRPGLLFGASLLLSGCAASLQTDGGVAPGPIARSVELHGVPFFAQQDYQCGPAALATLLNAAGDSTTPGDLVPEVFLPGRKGSLQLELVAATRRHRRIPYVVAPNLEALVQEVTAGHPVMVLQNLGLSWYPVWHYAVVIGFDAGKQHVILRSGRHKRHAISIALFERTWRGGKSWALLALEPGMIPATARKSAYFRAIPPLERLGHWAEAESAYRAGLKRWPGNLPGLVGLGNSLYAQGKRRSAAAVLRTAVENHPLAAAAHNNLAHVLLELGETRAALEAAQTAVALGGDARPEYRATLSAVESRIRSR